MARWTVTTSRRNRRTAHEPTRSLSRYDLVLAVIPLAFLAAVAHVTASISLQSTLVAASGASALAVADALFLRPPGLSGRTRGT